MWSQWCWGPVGSSIECTRLPIGTSPLGPLGTLSLYSSVAWVDGWTLQTHIDLHRLNRLRSQVGHKVPMSWDGIPGSCQVDGPCINAECLDGVGVLVLGSTGNALKDLLLFPQSYYCTCNHGICRTDSHLVAFLPKHSCHSCIVHRKYTSGHLFLLILTLILFLILKLLLFFSLHLNYIYFIKI